MIFKNIWQVAFKFCHACHTNSSSQRNATFYHTNMTCTFYAHFIILSLRLVSTQKFWRIERAVTFKLSPYVKVYISRMEISQRIYFWHQDLLKNYDFLRKWQKITFLVKLFFKQPTKCNFELKMLELYENHLKTNV